MAALNTDPPAHRAAHTAPELAPLVADLYAKVAPGQRLRLLNSLLRPVGPLALVAIATGAFASLLPATRWHVASASLDDAMRFSAAQVLELARYVEQKSPEALLQLPDLLSDSPLWVSSLGGALLLLALRAWQRRHALDQPSSRSPL